MTLRIGFVGLGDIGMPMARCVVDGGFQVSSCAHRRREAIETLKLSGLTEVDNPYIVAKQSDVLITMVVDEAQTDNVLRGELGALAGMAPGSVIVVMSTVSPEYCQRVAAEASKNGIAVLDCPVSGGRQRAADGTLALICGGDTEIVERCRPVLETMGTIFHCGAVGMGQIAKLANNALVGSQFQLVQEIRSMSQAHGMDLEELMNILTHSSGTSFVVENWNYLEADWDHFSPMVKKDLDLCLSAAGTKSVCMPLVEAAVKLVSK
jgi:3-hydroxyisobutyrate dehydrogenase